MVRLSAGLLEHECICKQLACSDVFCLCNTTAVRALVPSAQASLCDAMANISLPPLLDSTCLIRYLDTALEPNGEVTRNT